VVVLGRVAVIDQKVEIGAASFWEGSCNDLNVGIL